MNLNEIQQALKVPKLHENKFAGYKYRNCEDILEAVKPMLGHAVLIISDEVVAIGDRFYVKATARFWNGLDGSEARENVVTAYAREPLEKKGSDASQITGAASSYARKYALNGLFLIDDAKDADSDEDEGRPAPKPATRAATKVGSKDIAPEQVVAAHRERIMALLKLLKAPCKTKEEYQQYVLTTTGVTLEEANYEIIIDRLALLVDERK